MRFLATALARPSQKAQFDQLKEAAIGQPKLDTGGFIEMSDYHVFVNPRDPDALEMLKKLSVISDDYRKGGTAEERRKFLIDTVKAYMDSH